MSNRTVIFALAWVGIGGSVQAAAAARRCQQGPGDRDGDCVPASQDCDDANAKVTVKQGLCDCSKGGTIKTFEIFKDQDHDGFGDAKVEIRSCSLPGKLGNSLSTRGGDCRDKNASINPDATEVCNGVDDDCGGKIDDVADRNKLTFYVDGDGDTYGSDANSVKACKAPAKQYVLKGGDCDDSDKEVSPGGVAACACSAGGKKRVYHLDFDRDGAGAPSSKKFDCSFVAPRGYVTDGSDCDDRNAAFFPGAPGSCHCPSPTHQASMSTYYLDCDGDTYGRGVAKALACSPSTVSATQAAKHQAFCAQSPARYVATAGDCNDADRDIRPGGQNTCDCSKGSAYKTRFYADVDRDAYGDATSSQWLCEKAGAFTIASASDVDCNDGDALIHPRAVEICDGVDNDCVSGIDAGVTTTYYKDADHDGFGVTGENVAACSGPKGYVATPGDCRDRAINVNPRAIEQLNGRDDDCDGSVDEDISNPTFVVSYLKGRLSINRMSSVAAAIELAVGKANKWSASSDMQAVPTLDRVRPATGKWRALAALSRALGLGKQLGAEREQITSISSLSKKYKAPAANSALVTVVWRTRDRNVIVLADNSHPTRSYRAAARLPSAQEQSSTNAGDYSDVTLAPGESLETNVGEDKHLIYCLDLDGCLVHLGVDPFWWTVFSGSQLHAG